MILPEAWRAEVKGFDAAALARTIAARGLMIPGEEGRPAKKTAVPGYGKPRLYVLAPDFLAKAGADDAR
jgi:hypothetical protein